MAKRERMKGRKGRKGRSECFYIAWNKHGGFLPFLWGVAKWDCDGMISQHSRWNGDAESVRVRITEIVPKSKKASKRKGKR